MYPNLYEKEKAMTKHRLQNFTKQLSRKEGALNRLILPDGSPGGLVFRGGSWYFLSNIPALNGARPMFLKDMHGFPCSWLSGWHDRVHHNSFSLGSVYSVIGGELKIAPPPEIVNLI